MIVALLVLATLVAIPVVMVVVNLLVYRSPPSAAAGRGPAVSVLIPARNEEARIGGLLESLHNAGLNSDDEVIVYDDHSEDGTAGVLKGFSTRFSNYRVLEGEALPEGWNGKQHACYRLADAARRPVLIFVDADVRFEEGGINALRGVLDERGAALVSGIPRQLTETFWERALIPQIHFILLGYLPLLFARVFKAPAFAAGCGQMFIADAAAYGRVGGHKRICDSRHDGLHLPTVFRREGFHTDLVDLTRIARCRMYDSGKEVFDGLLKNAGEGLGAPQRIVPMSLLLLGAQTVPALLAIGTPWMLEGYRWGILALALLSMLPRFLIGCRFALRPQDALIQPFSVAVLVGIQWRAWLRGVRGGGSVPWKGRG